MTALNRLCVGLLAGGKSRRMGKDKALLVGRDGRTLAERALCVLRSRFHRVFVLGGSAKEIEALRVNASFATSTVSFIEDAAEACGPMAGVIAALRSEPQTDWLIAACDMPAFDERGIDWLTGRRNGESGGTFGAITGSESAEPLLAIYASRSLERLEEAARIGSYSLRAVLPRLEARVIEIPGELKHQWRNVNTPEEWELYMSRSSASTD